MEKVSWTDRVRDGEYYVGSRSSDCTLVRQQKTKILFIICRFSHVDKVKKVKVTLRQATKTQSWSRGIAVLFSFNLGARWWWGTRWRTWLRHCATNRKVAGSIPDGVIGIFHWHNPSCRILALVLTEPLTEMSTRNISWGVKAAGA